MPCQPLHNCVGLSECQLSLPPHSTYYYIQARHGKGEEGISESVAAAASALGLCKVLCGLLLTAGRNTPFLSSSARQSYAHCCSLPPPPWPTDQRLPSIHTGVILPAQWPTKASDTLESFRKNLTFERKLSSVSLPLGSLAYCATPGGIDRDHWSWSVVDDVTIIDHFVKWSRQALE